MSGSKIFRRNRAMGYVSNQIPAVIRYNKKRNVNFVVTCIGKSFQTFETNHLRLIQVGNLHPDNITCLAIDNLHIYAASAKNIYAWRSATQLKHTYKGHEKNVHLLLPFGKHLIAVDEDSVLKIWDIKSEDVYLDLPFSNDSFKITAVMHPYTYLNKILLGSEQGILQLWNIKDCKLIYTFAKLKSKVTVLEQAPASDVAAVGLQDGTIKLLNLKFDETIMEFNQEWGPVTGISFRTDGHPIMATASTNGNVVFWQLEEKKLLSQLVAHFDSVTTLKCFPSEPLLLSTSPDNSLKMWIFDMPDGGARLLRFREGHAAPPLCIRYHGAKGISLLSAGEDSSLRIFSTISESLNKSMGRASYNRKASKKHNRMTGDVHLMPPISQFTSEVTREKEWDNIAAVHTGLGVVTSWSFDKCKMGELKLQPHSTDETSRRKNLNVEATCLCLTNCGNYVIIGYSLGSAERFNIQSGIHRATYGQPAHKVAVRGVNCDNLNQYVVTGDSQGITKFWNFKENLINSIAQIEMEDGITMFRSHRDSGMLFVALENFTIIIVDCDTQVIVRKFVGHTAPITDACFSPDSRWLISAALDSTIKVWDIPSSYLIDHFKLENACVSLSMSPTGDFLATAHIDFLGVFLWSNKTLFDHVPLRAINPDSEAPLVDLLTSMLEANSVEKISELDEGEELELDYKSPLQLHDELITMSMVAASMWQNLLNLDIIKKRNKPTEPPKTPKQAPFFLPTVAGPELKFDLSEINSENQESKIIIPKHFNNFTIFGKLLNDMIETNDFEKCIEHITNLGPSMVDFEIKSLSPEGGGSISIMEQFLKMIIHMMNSNLNFELAQTYLGVFLKEHGREMVENRRLRSYLDEIEKAQENGWKTLEDKLLYGLGVVSTLRNFVV